MFGVVLTPAVLCCDGGDLGCCSCWVVVVVQVMKLLVSWKLLVTVSSASARLTLCSRSPSRLSSSAPAMALSHCTRGDHKIFFTNIYRYAFINHKMHNDFDV